MKIKYKTWNRKVRKTRSEAGTSKPKITGRLFDAVAYAAALEVLG